MSELMVAFLHWHWLSSSS